MTETVETETDASIYSVDVAAEDMQTLWAEVCLLSVFGGRKEGGGGGGAGVLPRLTGALL